MTEPRDPQIDSLREQLRALGYLDARVGRFVLGGAIGQARPAALAARASARIGLIAGVLLGPAGAVGLRARAPGLVTGTTDAIVLAGYLAIFFGLAGAIFAFASIFIAGSTARGFAARPAFPRLAQRAAAAAGVVTALACLAYLTLWWRAALGPASGSWAWTAVVVAVAVAISALLGQAVTITVLAFVVRLGVARALSPGLPLSKRATAALTIVALAGASALLLSSSGVSAAAPPPLTVVPTGQRAVVIALDGVDGKLLERLRQQGRLPHLAPILAGANVSLPSDPDRDPARVWTTIATGQPPERHGIRALESRQVAGMEGRLRADSPAWSTLAAATDLVRLTRPAIASGAQRLIPAFWEVAARAGLRTAVVHWWATWPAPADRGIVLTDRAILRLEHGGALAGEIAPESLYSTLREGWADRRARADALGAEAAAGLDDAVMAGAVSRSASLDALLIDIASDPALEPLDLLVVYLPGLDILQHGLLDEPGTAALAPSAAAARLTTIETYYERLDRMLGDALKAADTPDRLLLVVTQPGRVTPPSPGRLIVKGSIAMDARVEADVTDVGPTVLYALGIPIADDLKGHALTALFAPSFRSAHAVRAVSTYGSRGATNRPGSGQPLDREMIERMRSLGYVK